MRSLIITLCLIQIIWIVESTCYNYWNGDVLPISSNSSYCQKIITWPVSDEVLSTGQIRNTKAIKYYKQIYKSYQANEVTAECLGIVQYIACATTYPTCDDTTNSIGSICTWLCSLMEIRCGTQSQLYIDACVNGSPSSKKCSSEINLLGIILLLFTLTIVI